MMEKLFPIKKFNDGNGAWLCQECRKIITTGHNDVDAVLCTNCSNSLIENYHELMKEMDYWLKRCVLAENIIENTPCDPDITVEQMDAHNRYNEFIKKTEEK